MRLQTAGDFIELAVATPIDAAVGLTWPEIVVLEALLGSFVTKEPRLMGRRVVEIPIDWEDCRW